MKLKITSCKVIFTVQLMNNVYFIFVKESLVELIHMEDPQEFYGITFDGRPVSHNATAKYKQLSEYLDSEGIPFEDDTFLVASE